MHTQVASETSNCQIISHIFIVSKLFASICSFRKQSHGLREARKETVLQYEIWGFSDLYTQVPASWL